MNILLRTVASAVVVLAFAGGMSLLAACGKEPAKPEAMLDTPEHHYLTGIRLSNKEDWNGAMQSFQRAVDLDPKFAPGYAGVGLVHGAKGDYKEAYKAIDKAKEARAAGKPTHTLGQVVHNEGVIRDLQDLGIRTVATLDEVEQGAAVVIRAHGVRPEVMDRAAHRGLEVIDGTCTWVIQEQRQLAELVLTIGFYMMVSRFLENYEVDIEAPGTID